MSSSPSSSAVHFSVSSHKGKESPVTKQRIQFHIDSITGLPSTVSTSSAFISVAVDGTAMQHETGAVKATSTPSSRAWHENVGPIPLRETSEITFSLHSKSKFALGKRSGKLVASSDTHAVASLLALQGTSRDTRVSLPLRRSDQSECGVLTLCVRVIPSLTVPIGTDISKYMRSASRHRRSPTSSSLSISPTPTLESDDGYHSSSLSLVSTLPATPGEPASPVMSTILFSAGHEANAKPLRLDAPPPPMIVTTAPSP